MNWIAQILKIELKFLIEPQFQCTLGNYEPYIAYCAVDSIGPPANESSKGHEGVEMTDKKFFFVRG